MQTHTTTYERARARFLRESLRQKQNVSGWQLGLPSFINVNEEDAPTIISVGGGKGGVGKSVVSANLAAKLAQAGYRVLLLDLDLGCSNLHSHFGISQPEYSLADFLIKKEKSFKDILLQTQVSGIRLVAGGREVDWASYINHDREFLSPVWEQIVGAKKNLGADFVVLDLGAGTASHTLDLYTAAHLGVCTVLPEPTSIENAYVFLSSYLIRLVDNIGARTQMVDEAEDIKAALLKIRPQDGGLGYAETLVSFAREYPEFIENIKKVFLSRQIGIVVNQTRTHEDTVTGDCMKRILTEYFGFFAHYLGYLNYDDATWKSLRNHSTLAIDFPHSLISRRMTSVAIEALTHLGYKES